MKAVSILLGSALSLALTYTYAANVAPNTNTLKLTSAEQATLATIATIDVGEILLSEVALNKKNNSGVTDLARMMVDQHGSNLTQVLSMAGDAHTKLPLGDGESAKLTTEGKKNMMALGALQGEQFDKAYANAMVSGHEAALKLIDSKLMKTAKSEQVKKFLTDTRAAVAEHLDHSKKVQQSLVS